MNISPNTLWAVFWIGLFSAVVAVAAIITYDARLADEKRHARDLARIEQGQCEVQGRGVSAWYPCDAQEDN